jgi:hypothetical protein
MATKKPKKLTAEQLADRVVRYLAAKESGKRAYQRADRLIAELAAQGVAGKDIALNESGRKALLVDRFDGKDLIWTPCGARRWEIKVIEP